MHWPLTESDTAAMRWPHAECTRPWAAVKFAETIPLQVPTPIVEGDGAFSFHIPLPNPKGPIRAFLDRVREVLSSPLPPHYAPHLNALMPGALQCQHGTRSASRSTARLSASRSAALYQTQQLHLSMPTGAYAYAHRVIPLTPFEAVLARWVT